MYWQLVWDDHRNRTLPRWAVSGFVGNTSISGPYANQLGPVNNPTYLRSSFRFLDFAFRFCFLPSVLIVVAATVTGQPRPATRTERVRSRSQSERRKRSSGCYFVWQPYSLSSRLSLFLIHHLLNAAVFLRLLPISLLFASQRKNLENREA